MKQTRGLNRQIRVSEEKRQMVMWAKRGRKDKVLVHLRAAKELEEQIRLKKANDIEEDDLEHLMDLMEAELNGPEEINAALSIRKS